MRKAAAIVLLLGLLAGCAKNRATPGDFVLSRSGAVPLEALAQFEDCVQSAFQDTTIGLGMLIQNRQQRWTGMHRIEMFNADIGPVFSADIRSDGRYELHETTYYASTRLEAERTAFDSCVAKAGGRSTDR